METLTFELCSFEPACLSFSPFLASLSFSYFFLFKKGLLIFILNVFVFSLYESVSQMHSVPVESRKKESTLLELELQMAVICHVGTGN